MSDDTPVTLSRESREGGRQLTPEMWAAVQEELHDFLEEGKVTITPGGGLPKENPGPFSRKRKKRPKNNPPGTHMLVEGTADVLVQVEETLQRAIIPGLRVGRAKYRQSDFVAQRIMSLAVADTASETAHKMSPYIGLSQIVDQGGCQLSPETWAAVQEELHDLLEAGQIIIEPGGPRQKTSPPGPFSRKRKKRPENHLPGTHMRICTADVLDQVEQKLQRANIPELRVRKSKHRPSEIVALPPPGSF